MIPVMLDVDPGHDDAVAIMLACGATELEVRAVTTVAGNVPLEKTTRNALRVLTFLGCSEIPVAAGAGAPLERQLVTAEHVHGQSGLDGVKLPEPGFEPDGRGALRLMAEVVRGSSEPVALIPTGPLTNVAAFLRECPELRSGVERVVLMGGSHGPGNTTPAAEFNAYVDPEAARAVFRSGLPVTMVGLDVTRKAVAGPGELQALRNLGRVGNAAADLASYGFGGSAGSGPIHDAVAVAAVVEPGLLETRPAYVDVECEGGITCDETVCDFAGVAGEPPNAGVGLDLDPERFFELLYRSLKNLREAGSGPAS
jgi:pyrimidine-specific ribonucleoside hydrolase